MPITNTSYEEMEREKKGLLEIDVQNFYFNKLRPHMKDMLLKCKTDIELDRTIEKVINASDSFCQAKNYEELSNSFGILETAITDANYFNGVMKKAPEAEKEMVRDLIAKISDFRMILKCEPAPEVTKEEPKERLDYSPNGENMSFDTHNMKKLNEPVQKQRIPNR